MHYHTLSAFKTYLILVLSFSGAHIGLNMLGATTEPRCAYDSPVGFGLLLATFVSQAVRLGLRDDQPLTWVIDAFGMGVGAWVQLVVKPNGGWFGALPEEGCHLRASGYAMALWILGELLTFGTGLRVAVAIDFGRNVFNTGLFILAAFVLQLIIGMVPEWVSS